MPDPAELEAKFWDALESDRTMMLGLDGVEDGHAQPMTALTDPDRKQRGPIWFFTTKTNGIIQAMKKGHRAMAHFAAKDHDLFASIHGNLVLDDDRAVIDRLWNPFVAAWFEGGKDDPELQLIRLDAEKAEIWLNEASLFAGVKLMFGADPKDEYKDKTAEVSLK
jgi:general stress protein 26